MTTNKKINLSKIKIIDNDEIVFNNQLYNKPTFEELKNAVQPLVDIINKYYNPHTTIIVEMDHAEILCGDMVVPFEVKD